MCYGYRDFGRPAEEDGVISRSQGSPSLLGCLANSVALKCNCFKNEKILMTGVHDISNYINAALNWKAMERQTGRQP